MATERTQNTSLAVSSADVRKALRGINPQQAAGSDNIPGHAIRVCSSELTDVLADIYNVSLTQASVPTCFKSTTIVPFPKKSIVTCLNDYHPIALTPIIIKCLERIIKEGCSVFTQLKHDCISTLAKVHQCPSFMLHCKTRVLHRK